MKKSDFLKLPEVSGFLDYFKEVVYGENGTFLQRYTPENEKVNGTLFSILSFKQAFDQYRWEGRDFNENHEVLKKISRQLKKDLKKSTDQSILIPSLEVLDWGGVVNRYSVRWLVNSYKTGKICNNLNRATNILCSDDDSKVTEFKNNSPLRSDSATTKIYSLAGTKSIVYDNRVGAALGRIVRSYLESIGAEKVPESLNFMRGGSSARERKIRNPSTKKYSFQVKETGYLHALSNIRANWLIQETVEDTRFEKHFAYSGIDKSYKMRVVESALFMIGYDLTAIGKIAIKMTTPSKKKIAKDLYVKGEINCLTPKQTKNAFVSHAGLTINGANTYFSNFKNNIW